VLLEDADGADEGGVLGEEDDEDVERHDGDGVRQAPPAQDEQPRPIVMQCTSDRPAGEQPGRINEEHENQREHPAELGRNHRLNFQQVKREREQ